MKEKNMIEKLFENTDIKKCEHCGLSYTEKNNKKTYVKYPIKDESGKINYLNFFKMDLLQFFIYAAFIISIWGMANYIKPCMTCAQYPCEYAANVGCNNQYLTVMDKPKYVILDNGSVEAYIKQSGLSGKYDLENNTKYPNTK